MFAVFVGQAQILLQRFERLLLVELFELLLLVEHLGNLCLFQRAWGPNRVGYNAHCCRLELLAERGQHFWIVQALREDAVLAEPLLSRGIPRGRRDDLRRI